MFYLYHGVPDDLKGDFIYPLNTLKDIYPDIYKKVSLKYKNREILTQQKVYPLDCLWNDVIHLTAIPPQELKKVLVESGVVPVNLKTAFFKIDPELLDPEKTTVYVDKGGLLIEEKDFLPYKADEVVNYSVISEDTKNYYKDCYLNKRKCFTFFKTAHILYKGAINVKDLEIIEI